MPRSLNEILENADKLAEVFDHIDPSSAKDAEPLRRIVEAVAARAASERRIADSVEAARAAGHSWAAIGAYLGTSGEAARQKYGSLVTH